MSSWKKITFKCRVILRNAYANHKNIKGLYTLSLTFSPLKRADNDDTAWFHAVYDEAFPDFEQRTRKGRDYILRHAAHYQALIILDGDTRAGILGGWSLQAGFYIEHFAVDRHLRGRQLGRQAMAAIVARYGKVILEIDPPKDHVSQRRLAFYQACGFVSNPYPHRHPSYKPQYAPHSLVVLSHPETLSAQAYQTFAILLNTEVMAEKGL